MPWIVTKGKRLLKNLLPEERHYVSYTRRVQRIKTRERVVAMTFDGGPVDLPAVPDKFAGRSLTDLLLDQLKEYDAKGTFLIVGDTGENYPDQAGKLGRTGWNGVRYAHCPDLNQDERGGAAHNERLLHRILNEGHQVASFGYRHIPFGKSPLSKRACFHSLDQVTEDLSRLHILMKKTYGYEIIMGRPPFWTDPIEGGFTAYDAFDRLGYLYLAASMDGGGWQPAGYGSLPKNLRAEAEAMTEPLRQILEAHPDALAGQIIAQRHGYNMARRTPVALGLPKQLALLKQYGYRVVTAQELMTDCPFTDLGRDDPSFEKLAALQRTRAVVHADNCLRLDEAMTWGELAMLIAPRRETIARRREKIRESGPQHANWGAMDWCAEQGILKYAMDPDAPVSSLPPEFFEPVKAYTRRQVYEAWKG